MGSIKDVKYEIEIEKHIKRNVELLNQLSEKFTKNNVEILMASERALQILIEGFIGFSRYYIGQIYGIKTEKTRDAIDILFKKSEINSEEYKTSLQIIAFRNILVHDYLSVEIEITENILKTGKYLFIMEIFDRLKLKLKNK